MSDKKIIFLDVDGTLIDYNAIMPSSAGRAVDEARKNGHLVYISVQAAPKLKFCSVIFVNSMV